MSLVLTLINVALQIIGMLWQLLDSVKPENIRALLGAPKKLVKSMTLAVTRMRTRSRALSLGKPKRSRWHHQPADCLVLSPGSQLLKPAVAALAGHPLLGLGLWPLPT